MIYLYSGTPGSGKSLNCAKMLYYRVKFGHPTIANFSINYDSKKFNKALFTEVDNMELNPDFLYDYSRNYFKDNKFREGRILLVIDECQIMFNAREWNMKGRNEWLKFFTQHRKFGYDIILIAQFDKMLDRQIRSLVEYEYIHRKVSNYGLMGKFVSLFFGGGLFCCVKMWYPMRHRVGSNWFKYSRKYSKIYDSYKMFDGD